jgi:phasin family protein
MSQSPQEQICAAQKTQFDTFFSLTNTAAEGFQRFLELNLQAVKSTLAEGQETWRNALSGKEPLEAVALHLRSAQPSAEKVLSYGRHAYEIATSVQAAFTKVAEGQYKEHTRRVQTLVDQVGQNAPVGSESAVTALKSAVAATNTLYETVHQATRQAVEVAEGNFDTATTAAFKATQQSVDARAVKK